MTKQLLSLNASSQSQISMINKLKLLLSDCDVDRENFVEVLSPKMLWS